MSLKSIIKDWSGEVQRVIAQKLLMTPTSVANLELFLTSDIRSGAYLLVPASAGPPPKLEMVLSIAKRNLQVRQAWEIGENDPDVRVLSGDDDSMIPSHVSDPPVRKAFAWIRSKRQRDRNAR